MFAATIGFFDGVHAGHRHLIAQLKDEAYRRGLDTMVITFSDHPRRVLQKEFVPRLLTTGSEKEMLLLREGVDKVHFLPFTQEMAQLTARQFMARLKDELGVSLLLIGYDNRFGHNRAEGFDDYVAYGREMDMEVVLAQVYAPEGDHVSSTAVRRCLDEGDVVLAERLLGRRYDLHGTVVGGRREGRKIGFPTANLRLDDVAVRQGDGVTVAMEPSWRLIPARGVYAVTLTVDDAAWYDGDGRQMVFQGMMNIGVRPTYGDSPQLTLEVHILDFDADIYGDHLNVWFHNRLREERAFTSVGELQAQLENDRERVRSLLTAEES